MRENGTRVRDWGGLLLHRRKHSGKASLGRWLAALTSGNDKEPLTRSVVGGTFQREGAGSSKGQPQLPTEVRLSPHSL